MNHYFCRHHTTKGKVRLERQRPTLTIFGEGRRCIVRRHEVHGVAVPTEDIAELGVTDARSIPKHGCKHRLEVAGGTADNLKNLGRRSLLLQRFREVGGAYSAVVGA